MHLVHLNKLAINYAGREIFRELSWVIGSRDRVGLVGPNGAGKSTLLKMAAGLLEPTEGQVVLHTGVRVAYLPQDIELPPQSRLIDLAMELPPLLAQVEAELNTIEGRMAAPEVYNDPEALGAVLAEQEAALARYERLNGPRHASRVRELLAALGFTEADHELPAAALSGGQKKLLALVRLAVDSPDVLLLDEPDNHLDMEGKRYLERFIRAYAGGVVVISHDRYLLDEVVTHIAELELGRLTLYHGSYSAYANERALRRLRQQQQYVAQQKEIARIEAAIARFELWASMVIDERHIRQARSRRKMLDRMEERGEIIEKVTEQRRMGLALNGWRGSTRVLEMSNVSAAFDDELIFDGLDLSLHHGERVGLIGPNGAGKSVLFRLILEQLQPFSGRVRLGPSVRIGYYSQEHQTLAPYLDRTPIDLVRDLKTGSEGQAVSFLLRMLFTYEQTRQPIRTMSGGERSRLQLAILMLTGPNLLLLDEPTNNLDIPSVEVLEEVLEEFEGTILTISHDRYFLDRVVDRVVELKDGMFTYHPGGYSDYLDHLSA